MDIQVSSHTDIGDKKQTNQDSILAKTGTVDGRTVGLYIVADGCGGLAFGEEISNLAVTHFSRIWKNELRQVLNKKKYKDEEINGLLEKAIAEINVGAKTFGTQVESKVGSTLSLLLTIDKRYYIKNVGDSRIYLKRKGKMIQLTEDQSLVADMIRNGELTKEEAKNFKQKNVLTMCIGVFDDIKTYSKTGRIKSKDVFVLCCDGVHNNVSSDKMVKIIENKKIPFESKAEEIRKSIEPGKATDNVSTVMCGYFKVKKKARLWIAVATAAILLASAAVCIFGERLMLYLNELMKILRSLF